MTSITGAGTPERVNRADPGLGRGQEDIGRHQHVHQHWPAIGGDLAGADAEYLRHALAQPSCVGRHDLGNRSSRVTGELFFASSNDLYTQFECADDPNRVVIDLTASHIWDASTVASLDAITTKYERKGKAVEIVGLNDASAERHDRLTGQLSSH